MTKMEFILALHQKLRGLPEEDRETTLDYYSEMIDDRMEDGLSEEDAVAAVGDPGEIAAQIWGDLSLGKLARVRLKPVRPLQIWEILLLILGAPLWLPLLLALLAVILAVYVSVWSVVISLYAVDLALAVSSAAFVVGAGYFAALRRLSAAVFVFGGGLVLAGLAILLFLGCNLAAKGTLWLGRSLLRGIRACFLRKGAAA